MADQEKKEEESNQHSNQLQQTEASAPLMPTVTIVTDHNQIVIDDNRPPPPYYEPLPPIIGLANNNNNNNPAMFTAQPPSTIILAPMDFRTKLGSSPARVRCPNCQAEILTQTRYKSGCMTWAICGSLCAIGLFVPCAWLGCQFIPFCISSCKDVKHVCPNCQ